MRESLCDESQEGYLFCKSAYIISFVEFGVQQKNENFMLNKQYITKE